MKRNIYLSISKIIFHFKNYVWQILQILKRNKSRNLFSFHYHWSHFLIFHFKMGHIFFYSISKTAYYMFGIFSILSDSTKESGQPASQPASQRSEKSQNNKILVSVIAGLSQPGPQAETAQLSLSG